jgi:hypothetical protein
VHRLFHLVHVVMSPHHTSSDHSRGGRCAASHSRGGQVSSVVAQIRPRRPPSTSTRHGPARRTVGSATTSPRAPIEGGVQPVAAQNRLTAEQLAALAPATRSPSKPVGTSVGRGAPPARWCAPSDRASSSSAGAPAAFPTCTKFDRRTGVRIGGGHVAQLVTIDAPTTPRPSNVAGSRG